MTGELLRPCRTTLAAPAVALILIAGALGGCTSQNVVFERIREPYNTIGTRDTRVFCAGRFLEDGRLHMLANGDSWYDYQPWYDPYPYGPPYYGPWYAGPYYYSHAREPYVYELFLSLVADTFPPKGQKQKLAPDQVHLVFAKLDEGTVLTRLEMTVTDAEASWDGDRPVVDFVAEPTKGPTYRQRQPDGYGPVNATGVTILKSAISVRAILAANLSSGLYRQLVDHMRQMDVLQLMNMPGPKELPTAEPNIQTVPDEPADP